MRREVLSGYRTALCAALVFFSLAGLVTSAQAVIPGENGRIVLISGRTNGDAGAEIFLLPVISSFGGGTLSPPVASIVGTQHRHPTWSPDRTMIAYARGDNATGNFDIYVQDLTAPGSDPVNITQSNGITDDRPSWSPNGTRIAYESEVTDGSGQTDVLIEPAGGGTVQNLTNTATAGQFEGKPVWSPDSATIYYEKGNPRATPTNNTSIVRRPAAGGAETLAVVDTTDSEFQPSISPDGTKVCFTQSPNGYNNASATNVRIADLTTPPDVTPTTISLDAVAGDYNCTWSPDGQFIAYVNGIFGAGRLVMVRSDGTSMSEIDLAQDPGGNEFDGNPEWAPDARPQCPDVTIETPPDTPITFTAGCADTGPAYEQTPVLESADSQPNNGSLEQEFAGDPFVYTPNAGFTGTDSFVVQSFDDFGFGDRNGTVTINVRIPQGPGGDDAKCAGKEATITGTDGKDNLRGTSGKDVIAAGDGNDKVKGKSGNDLLCGGKGRDKLNGGGGRDKLKGGPEKDVCKGGGGRDKAGCEVEKSVP